MMMITSTLRMRTMVMMTVTMGVMGLEGRVGAQRQGVAPNGWKHGWDNSVCRPLPNTPGPGLPDLPESFSLRVEANLLMQKKTTTLHEYYDFNDNIAAVRQIDSGAEDMFFYLYNSNQFLTVVPDTLGGHLCYEQKLSATDNQDMFGLKTVNSSMDHIFSVKGALHFGGPNITQKYLGKETVRGIPCNKWQSCQYWREMDATSTVTWYFSDDMQWSSISGLPTPVRCHVTGIAWVTETQHHPYEHIYEFYDFQPDVTGTDRHFDVPINTYCYSETNTKPLPSLPEAYSFNLEKLDLLTNTISFIREEYDNTTQLLRFDYRDPPIASDPNGANYMSQYHDFNTGVAYIIDVMRANCTTTVIGKGGFDDVTLSHGDVRLKNPNEFLDLNYTYVYQGLRTTRGIACDTWAAERFDYPDPSVKNARTTWTWYFATAEWMRGMGFKNNSVMPVMLEIFGDSVQGPMHKQLSFYEFNMDEPDFLTWDLSPCFDPSKSRNYAFLVQGRYSDVVGGQLALFKYYVVASLQAVLGVAPLRIARLDVQEAGANTLVTFDLLDKAPLKGDVARIKEEPDLDTAFQLLNSSVYSGGLKIVQPSSTTSQLRSFTVMPAGLEYQIQAPSRHRRSAFTAPPPSTSGFSGGAMGGMAAGMLVLGALIGFAVLFLIYKVRGGTFGGSDVPMKKFENE